MTSVYSQMTASSVASSIVDSDTSRRKLTLTNIGSVTAYIGSTSSVVVTSANANGGYPILPGEDFYINDYTGIIYAITTTTSTAINVLQEVI